MVCIFLTGDLSEPGNKNIIVIKRSTDFGKTWSSYGILFKNPIRGVWGTEMFSDDEKATLYLSIYDGDCPFKMLQTLATVEFLYINLFFYSLREERGADYKNFYRVHLNEYP